MVFVATNNVALRFFKTYCAFTHNYSEIRTTGVIRKILILVPKALVPFGQQKETKASGRIKLTGNPVFLVLVV
jgi:hypothetical protein